VLEGVRQRVAFAYAREADLQGYLRAWLDAAEHPRLSVKLYVDADPYSFLCLLCANRYALAAHCGRG
jgi:hypothetical protein